MKEYSGQRKQQVQRSCWCGNATGAERIREAKGRKQVREVAGSQPRRAGPVTDRTLAFALKKGGAPRGF